VIKFINIHVTFKLVKMGESALTHIVESHDRIRDNELQAFLTLHVNYSLCG